ncbi:MAG: YfhO family protein [Acidobacteriia bacterium]|nr:YfhO family protein [Terriglobia bacterium]
MRNERENRDWLLAALLLAIVFAICNLQIVNGTAAPIWDAEELFAPAFTLIADHARAGRIVLWNPWVSGGAPDYAEPELGVTSPIAIFVGAITGGTESGFRAYWLLIWFLGPLGLLLLARQLRAPPWAGFVVALGFAFCGFYTGQAEHTSSLYSISFLPWILWRLDVSLETRTLRPAMEAGGLWGLSALGGYPGLTILNGGFLFLWMLGRCWFPREDQPLSLSMSPAGGRKPRLSFGLLAVALVLFVGLPILAPTYLAFFAEGGNGYSDRGIANTALRGLGVRPRDKAIGDGVLEAGALSTFASPYLATLKFGEDNSKLWPRSDISLTNIYLGASISILGLLAIINRPGALWRWWLLAVAAFFFACALGNQLPVRGWLYDYCPPTRYFRNPAMFRIYAMLCVMLLALLAGKDLQAAIKDSRARIWKHLPFAAVIAGISALTSYYVVLHGVHTKNIEDRLAIANTGLACLWLGSIGLASLLLFRPGSRRLLPVLLGSLAISAALFTIRLASPTVYSTTSERQVWTRIDGNHSANLDLTRNGLNRDARPPGWIRGDCPAWWSVCSGPDSKRAARTNENVPMKMATFFNYATLTNRFQMDFEQHPVLVDMATGTDRIWFSTDAAIVAPTDPFYAAFVKRSEALGAPVMVVHSTPEMARIRERGPETAADREGVNAISKLPAARRVATRILRYTPNAWDLEVSCPQAGWLLVTERWSRGWRAGVNGQSAEVFGADFIFRAVGVRAGENRIQFDYRPAGWHILLVTSWGTLALVLAGPHVVPKRPLNVIDSDRCGKTPNRRPECEWTIFAESETALHAHIS